MIGGGAYMIGKHRARAQDAEQYAEDDQDARLDQLENQQAAPAPAPAPAAGGVTDDLVAQLERLGKLRDENVLTDEEFEAQKKKLLGAT
jgi:hypothetical protein